MDTLAPNHKLALNGSEECEILAASKNAEQEAGGGSVFINPLLCKSYRDLAPLLSVFITMLYNIKLISHSRILTCNQFNGESTNSPISLPTAWKSVFPRFSLWYVYSFMFLILICAEWLSDGLYLDWNFRFLAILSILLILILQNWLQ